MHCLLHPPSLRDPNGVSRLETPAVISESIGKNERWAGHIESIGENRNTYYQNCSAKTTHSPRTAPWWNKNLSELRAKQKSYLI
jgi:hypothetical protein